MDEDQVNTGVPVADDTQEPTDEEAADTPETSEEETPEGEAAAE